jgi:succinylglutamate desuccinylase
LHGNEVTGWQAVQRLLLRYAEKPLPRSLSILVGNVEAARYGARRLDEQPDFNRIWPTATVSGDSEPHQMAAQVYEIMAAKQPLLAVDIHNNTGVNPHYACINFLDNAFLHVARLFSRIVVHFTYPEGVLSQSFASFCPSITIECGLVGSAHSVEHALTFLDSCLHLPEIPQKLLCDEDIDLFENFATMRIVDGVDFGFGDPHKELSLLSNWEQYNFSEVPAGTRLADVASKQWPLLSLTSNDGEELFDEFFDRKDNVIVSKRNLRPSMFTCNIDVIKKDCLCYLMGRIRM